MDKLDQIKAIIEDGDTPKGSKVKVEQTFLFGRFLTKTVVTFVDGRDKWVK